MSESRARSLRRAIRHNGLTLPKVGATRAFRRAVAIVKDTAATRRPRSPEARHRLAVEALADARRILIASGNPSRADALIPQESARTVYAARSKGDGLDAERLHVAGRRRLSQKLRRLAVADRGGWLRC